MPYNSLIHASTSAVTDAAPSASASSRQISPKNDGCLQLRLCLCLRVEDAVGALLVLVEMDVGAEVIGKWDVDETRVVVS